MKKILFLLISSLFFVTSTKAQMTGQEDSYLASYKSSLPYFQELITGGQYVEVSKTIEGHPFYISRQFMSGILSINDIVYPDVPLLYDCYRDQVVTFHPIYNQRILINPDKIDEFLLSDGERFKFMEGNNSYIHHLNGLYQVLNEGETLVLVKQFKTTKSKREMSIYTDEFIEKRDFFIWNSGVFTSINKAEHGVKALGLDSKLVKKHIKEQKIRFRESPEKYLLALVEFSNSNTVNQTK